MQIQAYKQPVKKKRLQTPNYCGGVIKEQFKHKEPHAVTAAFNAYILCKSQFYECKSTPNKNQHTNLLCFHFRTLCCNPILFLFIFYYYY